VGRNFAVKPVPLTGIDAVTVPIVELTRTELISAMTELRMLPEKIFERADATLARAVLPILLVKPGVLMI
jgi:hypothetical protein